MDDSEPHGVAPLIEGLRGGSSFHDSFCLHMVGLAPNTRVSPSALQAEQFKQSHVRLQPTYGHYAASAAVVPIDSYKVSVLPHPVPCTGCHPHTAHPKRIGGAAVVGLCLFLFLLQVCNAVSLGVEITYFLYVQAASGLSYKCLQGGFGNLFHGF